MPLILVGAVLSEHMVLEEISAAYHGVMGFILHGLMAPFWLAMAGLASAWYIYMKIFVATRWAYDSSAGCIPADRKYYMDDFNQQVFAKGSVGLGNGLMAFGERLVIDGLVVNGSAKVVGWFSGLVRHVQTGYLYHYAFSMVAGILLMLTWFLFFRHCRFYLEIDMLDLPILSLLIWLPIIGGMGVLIVGDRSGARQFALGIAVLTFLLSLPLYTGFDRTAVPMQFEEWMPWVEAFKINYHLGVDGISMPLLLLNTFMTVLVVVAGWEVIQYRVS